jgi:hypothetical protein
LPNQPTHEWFAGHWATSGLYGVKQYWYSVAPYGADIDQR